MIEVETPHGPARAHLDEAPDPVAALVLGHGAGGGVGAPDLVTARDAALRAGVSVALIEQPYRVAGRRSSPPAKQLDAAWLSVVEQLFAGPLQGLPLIAGGRSAGARVACRAAAATGAAAVLCLAFPLRPPARAGREPGPSRLPELEGVGVPLLVVQGKNDRFGMPPPGANRTVIQVTGDHSLRSGLAAVGAAVGEWLQSVAVPE